MSKLNSIVEQTLKSNTGINDSVLNNSILFGLEKRLLSSVQILTNYKDAKRSFQKAYFSELLTLNHGNIKSASKIAGMDRRQIHRICKTLNLDTKNIRENLIKPYNYLKQNIQDVVEQKIELYKSSIKQDTFDSLYKKIPTISEDITLHIEKNSKTYDEAILEFEKDYFLELMRRSNNNFSLAEELSGLSIKSINRKLKAIS